MDKLIYALCALTALACTVLLLRAYLRNRYRLLLWSGLCFGGLTVNNALLVLDKALQVGSDFALWRLAIAFVSTLLLVAGLVLEGDS